MAEKNLTTRIKHKTDTSANWAKAVNFVPLKGEIIVYSDLRKIKIGDGITKVNSLDFLADNDIVKKMLNNTKDFATIYSIPDILLDFDGTNRVPFGEAQLREVAGNSIVYNQNSKIRSTSATIGGLTFAINDDGSLSISGTSTGEENISIGDFAEVSGHKFLAKTDFIAGKPTASSGYWVKWKSVGYGKDYGDGMIFTANGTGNAKVILTVDSANTVVNCKLLIQLFDLTLMGLDSVSTVEEARSELLKRGIDIDQYNQFSDGEIRNTTASGVKVNGYNLFDGEFEGGAYSGSTGLKENGPNAFRSVGYTKVTPGKKYTLYFENIMPGGAYVLEYDKDKKYIKRTSSDTVFDLTLTSSTQYITIFYYKSGSNWGLNVPTNSNTCFHLSTLRTGYAPYKEPKVISFASTELLSAGYAHDTIEVVEGDKVAGIQRYNLVHVKRVGTVDLGTLVWTTYSLDNHKFFMSKDIANLIKPIENNGVVANLVCSKYRTNYFNSILQEGTDKIIAQTTSNQLVEVKDTSYTDATAFKTAMSGVIINYELANPIRTTIAENLTFEEVSATIEQGGSIETIYETLAPNCTMGFFTISQNGFTAIPSEVNERTISSWGFTKNKGTVTGVNGTSPDANGNVQLNIPTVNNGLLTIQRNGANVATFHANQSGDTLANISVPTELAQLGGRTFSNITSRGEEYLEWGGPAKVGDVSPIGTAMSSEHNANRIAFINPAALKVEYSSDGGSTWTDYPITETGTDKKTRLCTKNTDYRIGRPDNSTNLIANKSKTRITITGTDGKKQYVYSALKKMLINVSTATALSLLVERRTGANYESNGAWETVGTYQLAGWSGWNDIPLNFALGGGLNQKSNYWQMRLTITCTTVNNNYPKEAAVLGLRLFGTTSWFPPSTLAETGHLYSFDMYQNAIFPAAVSATTFMENNKVLSDKYLGKTAQAADSAKLNGQPSSHYLTSIKMNGTTKTSTNSTIDLGTVITDITDLVPYTGATKDVNLGNRSFTMNSILTVGTTGTESATYVETTPGSITLKTPTNTIGIGVYAVGVNGTRIYWPKISGDPNGEYFALRSDITSHAGIDKVGTVTSVNGTSPDSNGNVTITILSKNEADNYYVKKLGSTGEYKVYMSSPAGNDASRTIATAPIGSSVPIRTKEGHILLPDASVSMPAPNEAISAGVADDLYGLDRKTKDFHPTTTLRWLNDGDQREMVINGSWIGFYKDGKQTTLLYPDKFTYLNKNVNWSDLADLVENGTVLLNGDTGSIGSYTSVGNGISSALNFAGQNISNTAKGVNSLSLGRLNSVEGAACFAYGNKNIIKGVASIAFGGGNTAGEKIDWTSLDAATNSSSSYCFAIGENNTSIGRTSITIGTANNSKGDGSISIGRDNTIWSKESIAIGRNNYLNRVSTGSYEENEPDQGNGIVAIGTGLKTPLRYRDVDYSNNFYWNCVIYGRYNDPYAYNCVRSSDLVYASNLPPLFTLGNGLSDTSRNNAIVLFHNASAINSDFIYFNEYSIFNKKCEFRGSETIIEGTLKDASGTQYIKGGTITASFINSLF